MLVNAYHSIRIVLWESVLCSDGIECHDRVGGSGCIRYDVFSLVG